MNEITHDQGGRRSYRARTGIAALNLIAPGLGLFRVGNWRVGALFLLAPFLMLPLFAFGMGHLPITSYGGAILTLVMILGLLAALYIVPVVLTWRESSFSSPARIWSRWYSLTAIAIVMQLTSQLAVSLMHHFYKPFYAPAESMAPTIGRGDRFIVNMRWRGPFQRGEIIVFKGPDNLRISRIVAISGDRIAMRDGVPILNGKAAVQSSQGEVAFMGFDGPRSALKLAERLPGEASVHRVLDTGRSEFDDTPEAVVPPNHVFVLGDNRDYSADSRVPRKLFGVGMVPLNAIIGRPMYIYWSSDHSKIGMRLDR